MLCFYIDVLRSVNILLNKRICVYVCVHVNRIYRGTADATVNDSSFRRRRRRGWETVISTVDLLGLHGAVAVQSSMVSGWLMPHRLPSYPSLADLAYLLSLNYTISRLQFAAQRAAIQNTALPLLSVNCDTLCNILTVPRCPVFKIL